ncbi:alpha-rhamnosidase [Mucilaginibacter sp. PPCGB 2223]|uniref:alpha-L-rhamnosidase-related protein n=1 Tax=Mucilaginibacter sp. PPCGB 2223 TaxID=1886027 RepID=UPI00082486F0|nr:trehalase family glycosidase [Mucilaginibacter sp. PPCGB 2223]OCX53061.1 alpha-rhamnosidase [Mucilaginibacter sp. PPCGB 2223]
MKKIIYLLLICGLMVPEIASAQAKKATWIYYPGDYEIWLGNKMQNRRTDRGAFLPVLWKMDSHYVLVEFHKEFDVPANEEVKLFVEGTYNVKIDGQAFVGYPKSITMPAGRHKLSLKVYNQANVPTIFVQGKTVVSDDSWLVTFEDKEWIDATGKVSDKSGTTYLNAGSWNFNDPVMPPSKFSLPTIPQHAISSDKQSHSFFLDFGKETFGFVKLHGLKGKGKLHIYYGESKEEALSVDHCETLDELTINEPAKKDSVMELSKALRYVNVQFDSGISVDSVSMLYEYAPLTERGSFKCSDEEINNIYDISKYTLHLATREFFIDGIKRDRWIWSGDAYQSYAMNYYSFFDSPTVTRTILALRGKDPVTSHINTIMDYTFYWFLSINDYYQYTGDKTFIKQFYPRMQTLMDYCLARRDKNGMMAGLPGDWLFIDWADGLSKKGELSFEQLLFCRSLETMAICAKQYGDVEGAAKYQALADDMKVKIFKLYWNDQKHALVHSLIDGQQSDNVTRYTNMFAIFFNYFNEQQKQDVKKSVLLNDNIQKITTPYMRFYELEALCAMGEQDYVLKQMKDYWGGMLKLGATSFWEEYNPTKSGADIYAMYGRPFGKSLCHAWGASPIYLLGKYYMGVKPTGPGYSTYQIEPVLGGLKWMSGSVPTPDGNIDVYASTTEIKVKGAAGLGTLRFKSKSKPVCKTVEIKNLGNNVYEVSVEKDKSYAIKYSAI